jgi:hypothetical protein
MMEESGTKEGVGAEEEAGSPLPVEGGEEEVGKLKVGRLFC